MYEPRFYREWSSNKYKKFAVSYQETDLLIYAKKKLIKESYEEVRRLRKRLDYYIDSNPLFLRSFVPLKVDDNAPDEVRDMLEMSARVGVGPMAGIAGLFAERIGYYLLNYTDEVIVENGGDIFLSLNDDSKIGLYAGKESPFSDKLAIKVFPRQKSLGICTSSGRLGPSFSKGKADAVTVVSRSTILADTAATAACNCVKNRNDIANTINWLKGIEGIIAAVIMMDDHLGVWGDIELIKR